MKLFFTSVSPNAAHTSRESTTITEHRMMIP